MKINSVLPNQIDSGKKTNSGQKWKDGESKLRDLSNVKKTDPDKAKNQAKLEEELKKMIFGDKSPQFDIEWKDLRFVRHESSDVIIVEVVNRETGEVLKVIPEVELLDQLAKLRETAGLTLNISG